jgi:hypothetical protein
MKIKLTQAEVDHLKSLVDGSPATGGYQKLLLHVWYHLDEETGEVELPYVLLERINRYAFGYKNSSWRRSLRRLFRRTLGANLDRGLVLR